MDKFLALLAMVVAPLAQAAECAPPPVRNSQQAICYAAAYADKNGLPHGRSFSSRATKGAKAWTVRFVNRQQAMRGDEWQVDVDAASGTVVRFSGHRKEPQRRP